MPKLWTDTIESHRHEVREAIMDTSWELASRHGPMAVTMSQVASETGIGRATLYKYFPGVEAILLAKHAEHVREHLGRLNDLRDKVEDPTERLVAVAHAYAEICRHRAAHGTLELSALTHQPQHVAGPEAELRALFQDLLAAAAAAGTVRSDSGAEELAAFCLHALGAASDLQTSEAVNRLTAVTLGALRPVD